jgi:hypothetical protein
MTTALTLFDLPNDVPTLSRQSHIPPKTSIEAYRSVQEMKDDHYVKIINALKEMKVGGNYEEISLRCGLSKDQVNRRLSELVDKNVIYNTGMARPTSSGRNAMVRQLKDI